MAPEQRLMAAVLDDALSVMRDPALHRGHRDLVRETERWFESDDTDWPFSFRNVCAGVGLDFRVLRNILRQQRAARERRLAA